METILQRAMREITFAIKTDRCPICGHPLYVDGIPVPKCRHCEWDMSMPIVGASCILTGEIVEQT